MNIQEDHRFADLAFSAVSYDHETRMARLTVALDPADGLVALVLLGVAALDVSHFAPQNVVDHLAFAQLEGTRVAEFVAYAQRAGAGPSFALVGQAPERCLGLDLIPADGADVFAVCRAIEKHGRAGEVRHRVSVQHRCRHARFGFPRAGPTAPA